MSILRILPVLLGVLAGGLVAAEEPADTPQDWIDRFAAGWDEAAWTEKSRREPGGYMREADDDGWELRMEAFHQLVLHGRDAVSPLVARLKSGDEPQRILAAQTLGYLPATDAADALRQAAREDENATVRLYAVDSLGMLGVDVDWAGLSQNESNGDVLKHISYAVGRDGAVLEESVVETLRGWSAATIDSARIGEPAPEFELSSAQGGTVRLADFHGENAVVLVFVYGDT